jgi:hypothetical protein
LSLGLPRCEWVLLSQALMLMNRNLHTNVTTARRPS